MPHFFKKNDVRLSAESRYARLEIKTGHSRLESGAFSAVATKRHIHDWREMVWLDMKFFQTHSHNRYMSNGFHYQPK
jgi:hypothetical protein